MPLLNISDIGPVKKLTIDLNRINIFIGPQGSGKSTVAKIISFCLWLEKDCVRRQTITHRDNDQLRDLLIAYHNMEGYFSAESKFTFIGDAIVIEFSADKIVIRKLDGFYTAPFSKNAYIPAERNIISVPGIFSTKMPANYILDFIDDWQTIRKKYRNGATVSLLGLGQEYTYDEKDNTDYVHIADGPRFPLSQVSSGLQSVTPLCVIIDYLTQWIYTHEEESSASDRQTQREAAIARMMAVKEGERDLIEAAQTDERVRIALDALSSTLQNALDLGDKLTDAPEVNEYKKLIHTLSTPSLSNIVIEEPELNLFPVTQVNLLYYLLAKIDRHRDRAVITTHSPYILYALNNCMLAHRVAVRDIPVETIREVCDIPVEAWTDPAHVSVWELDNGTIRGDATIQDSNGLIRDNYFDRIMQNVMVDFRNLMNFLD